MKSMGLVILFAFLAGASYADMVVEQKFKSDSMPGLGQDLAGQQSDSSMTMSIKGQKARTDLPGGQMSSIVDMKEGKIYMLDHKQKQIKVMGLEDLKKAADISAQPKDSQAAKSGDAPAKPTFTKTGKTETIQGYRCAEYEIKATDENAAIIRCWITEDVDDAEMTPFQTFGGRMGGFFGFEDVQKPKGMIMRSQSKINIGGREVNTSSEVQKIKKGAVDSSIFVLPPDYKRIEMPKFGPPPAQNSGSDKP